VERDRHVPTPRKPGGGSRGTARTTLRIILRSASADSRGVCDLVGGGPPAIESPRGRLKEFDRVASQKFQHDLRTAQSAPDIASSFSGQCTISGGTGRSWQGTKMLLLPSTGCYGLLRRRRPALLHDDAMCRCQVTMAKVLEKRVPRKRP
jgi:hypothetical protein